MNLNHVLKKVGRGSYHNFRNLHNIWVFKISDHFFIPINFWVNKSLSMMWLLLHFDLMQSKLYPMNVRPRVVAEICGTHTWGILLVVAGLQKSGGLDLLHAVSSSELVPKLSPFWQLSSSSFFTFSHNYLCSQPILLQSWNLEDMKKLLQLVFYFYFILAIFYFMANFSSFSRHTNLCIEEKQGCGGHGGHPSNPLTKSMYPWPPQIFGNCIKNAIRMPPPLKFWDYPRPSPLKIDPMHMYEF
jgi:hypothetical protein